MELIRNQKRVDAVQSEFEKAFCQSAKQYRRVVRAGRSQSGVPVAIYWDATNQIWARFQKEETKYWNAFGVDDPEVHRRSVVNLMQINPSRAGHKNTSGGFLYDARSGKVFVGHNGDLRGSIVGTREYFLKTFDNLVEVDVDGQETPYIVISAIDDPDINKHIAGFARDCAEFRRRFGRDALSKPSKLKEINEYAGKIAYRRKGYVNGEVRHGVVVNALKRELERRRLSPKADRARDIVVHNGRHRVLFEVKRPQSSAYDLYTAVGQLMMNGTAVDAATRCFVVLEHSALSERDRQRLHALEIGVVTYLYGDKPAFRGLPEALRACGVI